MSNTISPNMNLIVPAVGNEIGPVYAFDINNSLALIDGHDHSPGKGVQINPAGININATLPFNDNLATALQGATFTTQSSALTNLNTLSVAPGSGISATDLFFTDGSGNVIQITKSGAVNVVASSIPGETYAAGTFIWTQDQSGLPTTPANFDIGSITLRPNTPATTFGVTLAPNSGISSAYTINMPLLPATTSFLTINSSGTEAANVSLSGGITGSMIGSATITGANIAPATIEGSNIDALTITGANIANSTINGSAKIVTASITGTQIAAATVTSANIEATNIATSSSCGSFSTTNSTATAITNLSVTIITRGRPIVIGLCTDGTTNHSSIVLQNLTSGASPGFGTIQLSINGATANNYDISGQPQTNISGQTTTMPSSSVFMVSNAPGAGTYTITAKAFATNTGGGSIKVNNAILYAYELL